MKKKPYPKVVVVDFDGTICGFAFPESGPPEPYVKEALQAMQNAGLKIHIHSVSTNSNWGKDNALDNVFRIAQYMKKFDLVYDEICLDDKPFASAYIDDRGVAYRGDWIKAAEEAIRLGEME